MRYGRDDLFIEANGRRSPIGFRFPRVVLGSDSPALRPLRGWVEQNRFQLLEIDERGALIELRKLDRPRDLPLRLAPIDAYDVTER
jgi:hypothetical protein